MSRIIWIGMHLVYNTVGEEQTPRGDKQIPEDRLLPRSGSGDSGGLPYQESNRGFTARPLASRKSPDCFGGEADDDRAVWLPSSVQ